MEIVTLILIVIKQKGINWCAEIIIADTKVETNGIQLMTAATIQVISLSYKCLTKLNNQ